MKIARKALAAAAGVTLTLALAGCTATGPGGGDPGKGGPVIIAVPSDQPGIGLRDGDSFTGFDVDVARYVAKELGYTGVTFTQSPSMQPETVLQSNQVKMIFAGYAIGDPQFGAISFAGPYFVAGQDLLVQSGNTDIAGPDSLNGKKLCSVPGSPEAKMILDRYASGVQIEPYDSYPECVGALSTGSVDAVTTDNVILAGWAAQPQFQGRLRLVGKPFSTKRYGVGIKKGDTLLCQAVNAALTKMVNDGSWQAALDSTVGPSGFRIDTSTNPPPPGACT